MGMKPVPMRVTRRAGDILAEQEALYIEHSRKFVYWRKWMRLVAGRSRHRRDASVQIVDNYHEAFDKWGTGIIATRALFDENPDLADTPVVVRYPGGIGGWVYFAVREADGAVKIGWAKNPSKRIKEFSAGSGPCYLAGEMPGTLRDESALHKRFKHRCVGGEWFAPNDELLELIRKWPLF